VCGVVKQCVWGEQHGQDNVQGCVPREGQGGEYMIHINDDVAVRAGELGGVLRTLGCC
jgi:hypothetical protein